jgi:hypothetical protein
MNFYACCKKCSSKSCSHLADTRNGGHAQNVTIPCFPGTEHQLPSPMKTNTVLISPFLYMFNTTILPHDYVQTYKSWNDPSISPTTNDVSFPPYFSRLPFSHSVHMNAWPTPWNSGDNYYRLGVWMNTWTEVVGGRDQHVAATKIRNYFRATISSGDVSAMPGVSILCHWQHNKN